MMVLDANYILRYQLNDDPEMFTVSKAIIQSNDCLLVNEVIAEVVYVLSGVYKVPNGVIARILTDFIMLDNMILHESKHYMREALQLFEFRNLDFVDCILCALGQKYTVKTFDKKLQKCLG